MKLLSLVLKIYFLSAVLATNTVPDYKGHRSLLVQADHWLVGQHLNRYGDSLDTVYSADPLYDDQATAHRIERYAYLEIKFPQLPWGDADNHIKKSKQVKKPKRKKAAKPKSENLIDCSSKELEIIDAWLTTNKMNEFGDDASVVYIRNPLEDPETGDIIPRIGYLKEKFPRKPWFVGEDLFDIDKYLFEAGLNEYGDWNGTTYSGNPLLNETSCVAKSRFEYLIAKFPDQQWVYYDDAIYSHTNVK